MRKKVDKDIISLIEELKSPDTFIVMSTDGSILEMTSANVYTRILTGESRSEEKPFSFSRYISVEHAQSPKTDLYIAPYNPKYMSKAEVLTELRKIKQ